MQQSSANQPLPVLHVGIPHASANGTYYPYQGSRHEGLRFPHFHPVVKYKGDTRGLNIDLFYYLAWQLNLSMQITVFPSWHACIEGIASSAVDTCRGPFGMYAHRTGSGTEKQGYWKILQFTLPVFGADTAFISAPETKLVDYRLDTPQVLKMMPNKLIFTAETIVAVVTCLLFVVSLLQTEQKKREHAILLYRCFEICITAVTAGRKLANKRDRTWFTSAVYVCFLPYFIVVTMLLPTIYFVLIQESNQIFTARPLFAQLADLVKAAEHGDNEALLTEFGDYSYVSGNTSRSISHHADFDPEHIRNYLLSTSGSVLHGNMLHFAAMMHLSHNPSPAAKCPLQVTTSPAKHLFGMVFRNKSPWIEVFNRAILAHRDEIDRIMQKYSLIRCVHSDRLAAPPPLTLPGYMILMEQGKFMVIWNLVVIIGVIDCSFGIVLRMLTEWQARSPNHQLVTIH